ncbi:MAG: PorT family protein, partial [Gemmatimonadota bacterium]
GIGLGTIVVQPEVLYVQRKATLQAGPTLKQNYVDVPVLIGFGFGVMVKPFIYVAPVLSFETSCGLSIDTLSEECTDFSTNSALFSGAIGAALDIGMFNIDVRYNLGFSDIVDGDEGRWNTLMIMGGLGLSLGL